MCYNVNIKNKYMFEKAHKGKRELVLKVVAVLMILSMVGFSIGSAFFK